jgi:transcriptional regulator with XRE-family HTH domain
LCILKLAVITESEILQKFGERVRQLRKQKDISQEELAHRADLHRTYIGMIERAEKNITLLNIEKIANALEVKIPDYSRKIMSRKRLSDFDLTGRRQELLNIVRAQAADRLSDSLLVVAGRIMDIPEYSCTINIRQGEDVTDFMKKWTDKFLNGYDNRPSRRSAGKQRGVGDPAYKEVVDDLSKLLKSGKGWRTIAAAVN